MQTAVRATLETDSEAPQSGLRPILPCPPALDSHVPALQALVGNSPAMRQIAEQVERVMDTDATVAIFGESGTGKEVVANAIHAGGPRSKRPFVAINCASIPASLQESELFGHERGAFTGALQARRGCFEQANGGTLMLDELGEMSPAIQASLLRTLQERKVRRVGGSTDIPVDVRIICATRRDLRAEVEAGRFRDDLYYRLMVYPIRMPPLRERRSDIPLLVARALQRLAPMVRRRARRVHPKAMALLTRYAWPGNVRELFNVIERSALLCLDEEILAGHLPEEIVREPTPARGSCGTGEPPCPFRSCCHGGQMPHMEKIERMAIEHALSLTGGNLVRTAALLGLSRSTLYRRLEKFGATGKPLEAEACG